MFVHHITLSYVLNLCKGVRELCRLSEFHPVAGAGVLPSEAPTCSGLEGTDGIWLFHPIRSKSMTISSLEPFFFLKKAVFHHYHASRNLTY